MKIPLKLYKYQPFSIITLSNLKNRQLWFSRPFRFNDPFDCNIRVDNDNLTENDYEVALQYFKSEMPEDLFNKIHNESGKIKEQFKIELKNGIRKSFEKQLNTMLYERGVCCFSEKNDDLLMWGHYADGHRGFCLEFDTNYDPFIKAKPVYYSHEIPTVNPITELVNNSNQFVWAPILTKADCWSYEKEWRVFHNEYNILYGYGVKSLTGIYFGAKMEYSHKEIISMVLQGSSTKLYEVNLNDKEFRLESREVYYTPYKYNNEE